jgi:hypothetical protein
LPVNLWLNHTFSSIYNISELLRQGVEKHGFPGELKILLSHSDSRFVARPLADLFFEDARKTDPDEYVDWCLSVCRDRGVDVFWPGRGAPRIIGRKAEFEALGVRLMVPASEENLGVLNDKALFYKNLSELKSLESLKDSKGASPGIPKWFEATNFEEFEKAAELMLVEKRNFCFKPAKSIYGLGFKIIREKRDPLRSFLSNDVAGCDLEEAKSRLRVPPEKFVKLLVMERLPGPEYSLDCLSKGGKLIKVSIRKKPKWAGWPEKLIKDDCLTSVAEILAERFKLSHIFNLQIMDSKEGPRILEINPRMAGGLYFSCLAGINYPYWALRLAMEPCEELIPDQVYDLYVNQVYRPFIYVADETL